MLKGINYLSLPQNRSIFENIDYAASLGFDGIEFVMRSGGALPDDADPALLASIGTAVKDAGMRVISVLYSSNWNASFTGTAPEVRRQAANNCRLQIRTASALGCDTVLTLPGFVGRDVIGCEQYGSANASYFPSQEVIRYDTAYQRAVEGLGLLAPYAADNGITICVENIANKFLLSPLEMSRFIDDIASPNVMVYFDLANVMPFGYPEHWIHILGKRIGRVHIKDYRRFGSGCAGFVSLLSGDVDFKAVADELRNIGYDGWVTAEEKIFTEFPEQTARNCIEAMQLIFGRR